MYADVLTCLTRDPLAGNVSPSLLGTQGTIPLSVVSTIPDIMKHYYDVSEYTSRFPPEVLSGIDHFVSLVVLAEKEVFLVTSKYSRSVDDLCFN